MKYKLQIKFISPQIIFSSLAFIHTEGKSNKKTTITHTSWIKQNLSPSQSNKLHQVGVVDGDLEGKGLIVI